MVHIVVLLLNERQKLTFSSTSLMKLTSSLITMLYAMVTKEEGFEYSSLEYFLEMREKIVNNQLTSEQASKVVGQVWFDKYYKKPDGEK